MGVFSNQNANIWGFLVIEIQIYGAFGSGNAEYMGFFLIFWNNCFHILMVIFSRLCWGTGRCTARRYYHQRQPKRPIPHQRLRCSKGDFKNCDRPWPGHQTAQVMPKPVQNGSLHRRWKKPPQSPSQCCLHPLLKWRLGKLRRWLKRLTWTFGRASRIKPS